MTPTTWSEAHLIETPKHLITTAASKNTAALGKVICDTAKNEERRCGAFAAHLERKNNPRAAIAPENKHVKIPGIIPTLAIAYIREFNQHSWQVERGVRTSGNDNIPVPRIVLLRLTIPDAIWACPSLRWCGLFMPFAG